MSQIVIGVVIAVISAIIISLFRIGGNQNVTVHHVQSTHRAGTLWKLMIVLGWGSEVPSRRSGAAYSADRTLWCREA